MTRSPVADLTRMEVCLCTIQLAWNSKRCYVAVEGSPRDSLCQNHNWRTLSSQHGFALNFRGLPYTPVVEASPPLTSAERSGPRKRANPRLVITVHRTWTLGRRARIAPNGASRAGVQCRGIVRGPVFSTLVPANWQDHWLSSDFTLAGVMDFRGLWWVPY